MFVTPSFFKDSFAHVFQGCWFRTAHDPRRARPHRRHRRCAVPVRTPGVSTLIYRLVPLPAAGYCRDGEERPVYGTRRVIPACRTCSQELANFALLGGL